MKNILHASLVPLGYLFRCKFSILAEARVGASFELPQAQTQNKLEKQEDKNLTDRVTELKEEARFYRMQVFPSHQSIGAQIIGLGRVREHAIYMQLRNH